VAESEGYSMVLSKEGAGILWYSPSVDITNKVIERIRTGNTRR
jgi:outer membrane protein